MLMLHRLYEEFWSGDNGSRSCEDLKHLISSWKFRYEILSASLPPTKIIDAHILLDPEEVWLAFCQSLHRDERGGWRVHFPATISPDCQHVMVLRTLYSAAIFNSNEFTFQSATLHLDGCGTYHKHWSQQKPEIGSLSSVDISTPLKQLVQPNLYNYRIFLSTNGSQLFFTDFAQRDPPEGILFDVTRNSSLTPTFKARISNSLSGQGLAPWKEPEHVLFHPWAPCLLIAKFRKVFVWRYATESVSSDQISEHSAPSKFTSTKPEFLCIYESECYLLERISISECGKYLVVDLTVNKGRAPVIVPIPTEFLGRGMLSLDSKTNEDNSSAKVARLDLALFHTNMGEVVKSTFVDVDDEGSLSFLRAQGETNKVVIQRASSKEGESLRLITLPTWPEIADAKIAAHLPSEREKWIKVVLDQASRRSYSADCTEQRIPAIIERDIRSLALPVRNKVEPTDSLNGLGEEALSYIRSRMAVNAQDRLDSFYQAWCEYLHITANGNKIGWWLEGQDSLETCRIVSNRDTKRKQMDSASEGDIPHAIDVKRKKP